MQGLGINYGTPMEAALELPDLPGSALWFHPSIKEVSSEENYCNPIRFYLLRSPAGI